VLSSLVAFAGLLSLPAATAGAQSIPGIPGSTVCKVFVGHKWQNPYPPNEVGKHYQVTVVGTAFSCKSADAYVKKWVATKVKPSKQFGPTTAKLSGAPSGYRCTSGISKIGTAYQGNCLVVGGPLNSSSFSWGPYNDS